MGQGPIDLGQRGLVTRVFDSEPLQQLEPLLTLGAKAKGDAAARDTLQAA